MNAGHYSSLLPDAFKHKSTRVRIATPQAILLDFHGTISERRWEDKVINPYVSRSIRGFVRRNFADDTIQSCLEGLRNESFEQRFRYKNLDAPIIDDTTSGSPDPIPDLLADQMGEFLAWQIQNHKETRESHKIVRLVWMDGLKRADISTPIYEDVFPCIKRWREKLKCKIYLTSSIDKDTLRVLMQSSQQGDLSKYIQGYLCPQKVGEKMISETYRQFYEKLGIKTHQTGGGKQTKTNRSPQSSSNRSSPTNSESGRSPKSPSLNSQPGECPGRPILFVTDSGQEAKAASLVGEGNIYECLLINRQGNKRIRSYYLSQFQYIEQLGDIEFV